MSPSSTHSTGSAHTTGSAPQVTEAVSSGAASAPDGFYHVCFAVPDLAAAMDELRDLLGVTFAEPTHSVLGEWEYSIAITAQAPHIELVRGGVGSPWETETPKFHHLGWWAACLDDKISGWEEAGAAMSFDGRDHGRRFAYLDAPHSGVRLEAVDLAQREEFLRRWAR